MKFSICTTWKKQGTLEEIVELAVDLHLDGIEIWDGHIDDFMRRHGCSAKDVFDFLKEKKLKCAAIAPYFCFSNDKSIKSSLVCAKKCIAYSKDLECRVIRTFLDDQPSVKAAPLDREGYISSLKALAALVEMHDIYFALETHNGTPLDKADYILDMLKDVGSEKIKVLFDGYNFILDGLDMMDEYKKLQPYIVHYHLKNYQRNKEVYKSLNEGDADFYPLIQSLHIENYMGYVSFEYFCDNPADHIKKSIQWIKQIERDSAV